MLNVPGEIFERRDSWHIGLRERQLNDLSFKNVLTYVTTSEIPADSIVAQHVLTLGQYIVEEDGLFYKTLYPVRKDRKPQTDLQLLLPQEDRDDVLTALHDSPIGGHFSFHRTYDRIRARYWWPSMWHDVKQWVTTCRKCQLRKPSRQPKAGKLQPLPAVHRPFERIAMDLVGPLPRVSQW